MADSVIFRRPAVPPPVRIRRDIKTLAPNDPIITFFARAVGRMLQRGLDDPLGWRYQAAIHDYMSPDAPPADRRIVDANAATWEFDPFASTSDTLPADRATFWRQCQHNCWYFLPWHRMYLHHFEKIVAAEIDSIGGGPKNWALPYWKWDARDGAGRIPEALRSQTLPDGSPNPLFFRDRSRPPNGPDANAGEQIASPRSTDAAFLCLTPEKFENDPPTNPVNQPQPPARAKFGGGRVSGPSANRHHGGFGPPEPPVPDQNGGILENTPHGSMHVLTGGADVVDAQQRPVTRGGWMRSFSQAALDPIFWLHHCNIDRLWDVWIQRKAIHTNPDDTGFLDVSFPFHAASGDGTMTVRQTLNTRKKPLFYEYDDTTDPRNGA